MHPLKLVAVMAIFAPTLALAQAPVTVVVDMTPVGRKAEHPTPEKPQYYVPVMRGYQEYGDYSTDDKLPLPSPHGVVKALAPELAKQGYRVIDDAHPNPDLVIDFAWGRIAPTPADDGRNQTQRYALTLGRSAVDVMMPEAFGHDQFMEATREERYFLVVTAYDYRAFATSHKNVILWKAKMSLPTSTAAGLADVILPLAKAGGPQFGRETVSQPKLVPFVPDGHVEVGTPVVKKEPSSP